jgi:hypothetical protein
MSDKKHGAYITTFTTNDSASSVMRFYTKNMKTLSAYGFQMMKKPHESFTARGIDPTVKNTIIYTKGNRAVQVFVKPHSNVKDLNKIVVKLFEDR